MTVFEQLDNWGREGRPCWFLFDFELERAIALPLDQIDPAMVWYDFRGVTNRPAGGGGPNFPPPAQIRCLSLPPYREYRRAFAQAQKAFTQGYSYLLNLCAATGVEFSPDLDSLFETVRAPYRLRLHWPEGGKSPDGGQAPARPDFLVFSPECFVRIAANRISTYPMKGSLVCRPDETAAAGQSLLANAKELAEHVTVVDLLRNDLGRVAEGVQVEKFRFLQEIRLPEAVLLQTSSAISGQLGADWPSRLGSILGQLLPAGSVSGAPKASTLRVIGEAETAIGGPRGFYTGVSGIFDGNTLDSAVLIRFLEDHGPSAGPWRRGVFRSGGGLTIYSDPRDEYRELVSKVALPQAPRLLETLRLEAGQVGNLEWHRQRVQNSLRECYGVDGPPAWSLDGIAAQASECYRNQGASGRWRLRIEYSDNQAEWTITPYVIRRPKRLFLADAGRLDYGHKYADRSGLDNVRAQVAARVPDPGQDWDLLLCRDGALAETSYSAILAEIDGAWYTPDQPILRSTAIAALLADPEKLGLITPRRILAEELPRVRRVRLVNAMLDFEDCVDISDIRY